jgi:putative oxidoreductase
MSISDRTRTLGAASADASYDRAQALALLFARLLMAPLFYYSGVGKVMAFAATASRLPGGEGPLGYALALCAVLLELGGTTLLVLGWRVRWVAPIYIVYVMVAALMFHQFWAAPPAAVMQQAFNFLKNVGLAGAFGMIWAFGAGPYRVGPG